MYPGMEQNVDQTDPEEVPEEEEGVAERSEIKEDEEEAEMKVVSKGERSCWNQKLFPIPSVASRCGIGIRPSSNLC